MRIKNIDLIVYDFDGVMTNNCVNVAQNGQESVICNRGDGLGVDIIRSFGVPQIILSTETNQVVQKRAQKLGLEAIHGSKDKKESLLSYCKDRRIQLSSVLYIGNDINDLDVMKIVGFPVCPSDAHDSILKLSQWVSKAKGGSGVIRELSDWLQNTDTSQKPNISETSLTSRVREQLQDSINLRKEILSNSELISWIVELSCNVEKSLDKGGKIFFAGNGGSFADAQHLAAEFVGRFMLERGPLSSICLGANSSLSSAVGNDYGFEYIFSRELESLASKNDIIVLLSTSGNSRNLVEAVKVANKLNIPVYGVLGKDGGRLGSMCSSFIVPSSHTGRIQEVHITIGHIICDLVDQKMMG